MYLKCINTKCLIEFAASTWLFAVGSTVSTWFFAVGGNVSSWLFADESAVSSM